MKRIYFLILGVALITLSFFLSKLNVSAATMGFSYPNGIYFERTGSHYASAGVPFYTIDGRVTYCVEPGVDVTTYNYHSVNFQSANLPYSESTFRTLELIGYYGFEYPGHQTDKYRVATQVLIWEHTSKDPIKLTTERYGEGQPVSVDAEKNEIMRLVNNHYKRPSFNGTTETAYLNKEFYIEDTSGVLSTFEIKNNGGNEARIEGNRLYITPKVINSSSITLGKKAYDNGTTLLWRGDDGSQVLGALRASDPVYTIVNLNTLGAKLTVEKVDKDTGYAIARGDASLKGAEYGLYDEFGILVTKLKTDENGRVTSDYLSKLGKFTLKELVPSKGYELDPTVYEIEITAEDLEPKIKVYEKIVERDLQVFKAYATDKTGFLYGEPNITFDIYLKSTNELVGSITTDKDGYAQTKLVYGTYILKQRNATSGFEKVKDFEVTIDENTPSVLHKTLANAEITAKLKLLKIDSESKLPIKLAGIQFKIKDMKTGKYVCQSISYPNQKEVCVFETDSNGEFMTPYPLTSGTYRIEEIKAPKGYLLNTTGVTFTIDENAKLIQDDEFGTYIKVEFTNKQIKGEIQVEKTGEAFKVKNGSFYYDEVELEGVEFSLYAAEDIKTADGVLHYHKGDLVKTIKTDGKGKVTFSDLYLGSYIVKETKTLNDFVLDVTEHKVTLTPIDSTTAIVSEVLTLKNKLKKGDFEFTKEDISDGTPLPNTLIEVYKKDTNELVFSGRTDKDGKIIIKNLKCGEYYFLEKEAPEGYMLNEEKMFFEIKTNGEVVKATMKDEKIKGDFEFTKEDISDGTPLPDTLIEVYKKDTDELVFSGRTDKDGKIIIKNLEYGEYYFLEKEAPEGYVLNEEKMFFEIKTNGEVVKATMKDEKIKAKVKLHKVDEEDKPLAGVVVGLYDANDNLLDTFITDEDGNIEVELEYGSYYFKEIATLDGYELSDEKVYFDIKENGEYIQKTLVNDFEEIEVPITSSNSYFIILPIAMIVIGTTLYLVSKKNKKF